MLVDAVQIERDLRRAAGRAGPHAAGHAAGKAEHRVLAEHRLADLELVDADVTHDQGRYGPRQFGQGSLPASLPCGRRCKASRRALSWSISRRPRSRPKATPKGADRPAPARRPGDRPGAAARAGVERDQTIQAGQADGGIGAAQGAAQHLGDQPFAGRGLSDGESAGKQEADQGHRPQQHEADAADHVSRGEVQRPLSAAASSFSATA